MRIRLAKSVLLISYVIALVCALIQPASAEAPHSSFKGMNWMPPDTTATIKPKWSVAIDVPKDPDTINAGTVATGAGNVYVFQKDACLR
jgi:outer membrane protein assembly factor BamB